MYSAFCLLVTEDYSDLVRRYSYCTQGSGEGIVIGIELRGAWGGGAGAARREGEAAECCGACDV